MNSLKTAELKNKKVLLRVDFDVPVSGHNEISETFRIKKQKETLDYLVAQGANVVMVGHITAVDSFSGLIPQLHILLGHEVNFLKGLEEIGPYLNKYAGLALLENIRQFEGEKENSGELAKKLAEGFDIYVNNAFAVCHRNHASVSAVARLLPSYAGFLIEEEVAQLSKVINEPAEGKTLVMGGAKAETKVPVIKNFLDKAQNILIGGVVANDILKEKGQDVGDSLVDENTGGLLAGLDLNSPQLMIPRDYNKFENKILDIGPETIKDFSQIIKNSEIIIWNGPMGMFEDERFSEGTHAVGQAISESPAKKCVGGGDTIAALAKLKITGNFDFLSTGGGAMLAFLAGEKLPGLDALNYYGK